ncbi:MAG: hypothetical protein KAW17_10270 [Candidatus Eisenbacteria sp.]|nr:hypothetical protein [Candidatus Eisenbacteria bacterium]
MKRLLLAVALLTLLPQASFATPMGTAQYGEVPAREYSERQDQCHLMYFNCCSGWTFYWLGYCFGQYEDAPLPPMYGTCFDLADCPGDCRHLEDVWWAYNHYHYRGSLDVEIYCADHDCCPVGEPIAGIYGYIPQIPGWGPFHFGGVPLCICEERGTGKFIVMITTYYQYPGWGPHFAPYSDVNSYNIAAGCETEWRCGGHSYVYRNVVSYCDLYGAPGPMWRQGSDYGCTNYPSIPPGCHNYSYNTGFFTEWLIDCYISCQGPTATEDASWSEIKALYR